MKRKMIGAATAYMSGLFFASFFNKGSDLLLSAVILPMFFIVSRLIKLPIKDFVIISVFFAAACSAIIFSDHFVYDKITAYDGTEGSFCGEVEDVEYYDGDKATYTLSGKINDEQNADIIFFGDAYDVRYGDIMTIGKCTFVIPESDYLFDSKEYYKSHKIFLTAENVCISSIEYRDTQKIRRMICGYREKIISEFSLKMGRREGAFLTSIVFGEKSGLDETEKILMYRCGIGHIMAVSGLHVSIIAAMLMLILRKLRCGRFISFVILNVFFVLMIIMVDSPVSAIRAAIMLDFMYSAKLFRRQNDTFNSLSAAVLVICIANPYVVRDAGFLLSVSGTFGIGVFAPYMTKNMKAENLRQRLVRDIAAMLCTMITLMPPSIFFFDETSVISPITNIFLVPLTVAAMIIGVIYVLTGGIVSMLSAAGLLLDAVLAVSDKLGKFEFTHFACGNKRMFAISVVCAAFVILAAAVVRNRRYISIAVAGALTVFIFSSSIIGYVERSRFKIAILGRSSNAAVVISYNGRADIIDLSGYYKSARYVRKYLSENGLSSVNTLSLVSDVPSQYAAYKSLLELTDINQILGNGAAGIPNEPISKIIDFGDSSLELKNSVYEIKYENGILEIYFSDFKTSVQSVNNELSDNYDISVYYGNISKKSEIRTDGKSVYLDEIDEVDYTLSGINNFEIIFDSKCSDYDIRRL